MVGLIREKITAAIEPAIVKKEFRGQDIGKMLLKRFIQEVKRTGMKFLLIKPVIRNKDAIALFHQLGFQNVGRIELFMELENNKRKEWKSGLKPDSFKFQQ